MNCDVTVPQNFTSVDLDGQSISCSFINRSGYHGMETLHTARDFKKHVLLSAGVLPGMFESKLSVIS